jgi:hypothetical protein
MKTYKLNEFATALAPAETPPASLTKLKRRILNWVAAGLINPVDKGPSQGTGIHRRFDHHELCKAAALLELARYRVAPYGLENLASMFDHAHPSNRKNWGTLYGENEPLRTSFGKLVEVAQRGEQAYFHYQPIVDIEEVFRGVNSGWGDSLDLAPDVHSQILLNLTKIFSELPDPKEYSA